MPLLYVYIKKRLCVCVCVPTEAFLTDACQVGLRNGSDRKPLSLYIYMYVYTHTVKYM